MNFKITLPEGHITQGFKGNANDFYRTHSLIGHTGIDIYNGWNNPIKDTIWGFNKKFVYKIANKDNKDLSKFRGVFYIVEADDGEFEVSYGHCNEIHCKLGTTTYGQTIATEGNTGDVWSGGVYVTTQQKLQGSTAGTHIHFQVRKLAKSLHRPTSVLLDENWNDLRDENGLFYGIPEYHNGLNGCVDPMLYVEEPTIKQPLFVRDLKFGMTGEDVKLLQHAIGVPAGYRTGYFGIVTLGYVFMYQYRNGLPSTGYVGPLTREKLNT